MENAQSSFWNFSDRLRLQPGSFANLSLNDSIWSTSYASKRPADRRNLEVNSSASAAAADYALFANDGWKVAETVSSLSGSGHNEAFGSGLNGGFNKGIYPSPAVNFNSYSKGINGKKGGKFGLEDEHGPGKCGKKNKNVNKEGNNNNNNNNNVSDKNGVDKRFKTLPPSEALPRNETVGGYIFVCNNDTMEENLRRQLFDIIEDTDGLSLIGYIHICHPWSSINTFW